VIAGTQALTSRKIKRVYVNKGHRDHERRSRPTPRSPVSSDLSRPKWRH